MIRGPSCSAPLLPTFDFNKITCARDQHDIVYPNSLWPWNALTTQRLFSKHVFSDTGWCKRSPTAEELLHFKDVPASFISSLSLLESESLVAHIRIPLKPLVAFVRYFFRGTGGFFFTI